MWFDDRADAGRLLSDDLRRLKSQRPVVLGLPRGGVVTARPVADALQAPLDVLVARKIGAPSNPEYAIGAVTARGTRVLNEEALRQLLVPPGYLEAAAREQQQEAQRREHLFRAGRPPIALRDRVVILVDDGIATGMTMFAAIADVRKESPQTVVAAAPVIAPDTYQKLLHMADEVVALAIPDEFYAVGQFYRDFTQTSDEEVVALLKRESPKT